MQSPTFECVEKMPEYLSRNYIQDYFGYRDCTEPLLDCAQLVLGVDLPNPQRLNPGRPKCETAKHPHVVEGLICVDAEDGRGMRFENCLMISGGWPHLYLHAHQRGAALPPIESGLQSRESATFDVQRQPVRRGDLRVSMEHEALPSSQGGPSQATQPTLHVQCNACGCMTLSIL